MWKSKYLAMPILTLLLGSPLAAMDMSEPLGVQCQVASWFVDDPIIDGPDPVGTNACMNEGTQFVHEKRSGGRNRLQYCPSTDETCMACHNRAAVTGCRDCAYLVYYYTDPYSVVHCVWATFETVKTRP